MAVRKLERGEWEAYFNNFSKNVGAKEALIEIVNPEIGDQEETKWKPLIGLSYDPKDDEFEVALEGLDHLIFKPVEIYIDEDVEGLRAVEVIQEDGTKQIIKIKPVEALPA
ncbi:MAG: DUF5335 domain-containing protein [Hydrogenothermaceae bacterium]|nr:DUF5335 domain-containing protein [Hydrogenothermaceae bacterium]